MIERPDDPAMTALASSVEWLRETEMLITTLKSQIADDARALSKIGDRNARIAAGAYAYWLLPEVPVSDIAIGVTGQNQPGKLRKLIGEVSAGIVCDRCEEDLPIASRQAMKEALDRLTNNSARWPEGYRNLCAPCEDAVHDARRSAYDTEFQARDQRRVELEALPYADYLATPDWQAARTEHLRSVAREAQEIRCETCPSEKQLGLYHQSDDALGPDTDIVLLCITCRDALLAKGKLHTLSGKANRIDERELQNILAADRAERFG